MNGANRYQVLISGLNSGEYTQVTPVVALEKGNGNIEKSG